MLAPPRTVFENEVTRKVDKAFNYYLIWITRK